VIAHQVPAVLREMFAQQLLAVLATQRDGHPYCSLVAFDGDEDLRCIYFVTHRGTRKYDNLRSEPRVSLLLDTRQNRGADFAEAAAATVLGRAEEVNGDQRDVLQQRFLAKHPDLRDFVSAPDAALLRVRVERYQVVTRLQELIEVELGA